jgi:F-type H+-transporting ATPase subunit gamma
MAKARAILKRRKAVRNIKKITRTMQMIATAKFQKSLKRAVSTKPYTLKVRELVAEVARSTGDDVQHPLLRAAEQVRRAAVVVITSNRGLCGAYNGNVLRKANGFVRQLQKSGVTVELHCAGKRGVTFFRFQKMPIASVFQVNDVPRYADVEPIATSFIESFIHEKIDALHVVSMNFISTGVQRAEVMTLLPLAGLTAASDRVALDLAEKEAQLRAGALDARRRVEETRLEALTHSGEQDIYEFSPGAAQILDELLPLTVKTAFFQAFLDATTSEHVARMIAMKSATDNADTMAKQLTLQANRARQSQITTELSEIMGGVEAMK